MIFLGAGASQPFGIPTLEEFSREVTSALTERGHSEILQRVESSLKEFDIILDFEALYSILEGLINPVQSVRYAGPITAYLVGNRASLPKGYDYAEVLKDLRKKIYEKCLIGTDKFKEVKRCYDRLFQVTKQNTSSEAIFGYLNSVNIGRVIVTTNYDMSLELFFMQNEIPIIDGFEDIGAFVKKYNPAILLDPYTNPRARTIIKLHGSIYQFFRQDEAIKTKLEPNSNAIPYKIDVEREMMIYPTKEKDILIEPYFSFLKTFKSIKWTKLLVIGYSFRDEPINTAILENMKHTHNSQLIVVNPSAKEVIENIYLNSSEKLNWKIPKHRLYKFSGRFGTDEVFEYLSRIERVSDNQDSSFDPTILEKVS